MRKNRKINEILMEDISIKLIQQLQRFNTFSEKKPLSDLELNKVKDNQKDFLDVKKELDDLLDCIKNTAVDDIKTQNKNFIKLHILLGDIVWFFENVHENFIKVIKVYPYEE